MNSSNRLTVLAADIRIAHADIQRGAHEIAERAITAGHMLIEAKAALPHGKWMPWLETNTGLSGRTARRYMQIAESGLESATVANLGLRGAAEAIGHRRPDPESISTDPEYQAWATEMLELLAQIETTSPGFRAVFRVWAENHEPAKRHGERLLHECTTEAQRKRLQKMIDVQERDSFDDLCDMMRNQVVRDHEAGKAATP